MLNEYVKKIKRERKKRCIPEEGMPHACKGMSKKKLIARIGNNKRKRVMQKSSSSNHQK